MAELLEVYDLKGKFLKVQERNKFYADIKKEFEQKGKITKKIKQVRLLLTNSQGRIYLQKRSKLKKENPDLYDKTIGGHVAKGYTANMAVIKECAEELGFPAAILSPEEFQEAIKGTDLSIIGIFKKIDHITKFESVRVIGKKHFIQPVISSFYIGYYDGAIRFVDGESSGVEVYAVNELKQEMKTHPERFTEDLKFMIKKYEKFLKPVSK